MHTLTKPTEAAMTAMTAIAEKMAEQWEVKFRKITTDINCAIHGLTDVRDKPRPEGRGFTRKLMKMARKPTTLRWTCQKNLVRRSSSLSDPCPTTRIAP